MGELANVERRADGSLVIQGQDGQFRTASPNLQAL
jgi:hypothetical protein